MPKLRYLKCSRRDCGRPINGPGQPVHDLPEDCAIFAAGVLTAVGSRCMDHARGKAAGRPLGEGQWNTHAKIAGMVETPGWLADYIRWNSDEWKKPSVWIAHNSSGYSRRIKAGGRAADGRRPSLTKAQSEALRALLAGEEVDHSILRGLTH